MRRLGATLAGAAAAAVLAVAQAPAASAAVPCPSPIPGAASSSRACAAQSPSAYDVLRARLGGDLAKALTAQQKLSAAISQAAGREILMSDRLTQKEAEISNLQDQIAQLDQQIADLQTRIDTERAQISSLARAMYRQPASFLDLLASSGNVGDALAAAADLVVAGQRAHTLQEHLNDDLATAQADRDSRQADLDQMNTDLAAVQSGLDDLALVQSQLDDLMARMADLIDRIRAAAAAITGQPADVTAALAQLLEQEEQDLVQEANAAAWAQANAGAGLLANLNMLPGGLSLRGMHPAWPLHGQITQPFGPTNFALEPPLGSTPHFHTGVDVAAPLGSPVRATADGVVVAVAHTNVGYGNYVIIAHGSGVLSLYGHLLATDVNVGQRVVRGQRIGREGSSGLSTGPHLHFEIRVNGQVTNPMRYLPPV